MLLTRYGLREWGLVLLVSAGVAAGGLALGLWPIAVLAGLAAFAGAAFFRDPIRRIPAESTPGEFLAPADGRISAIESVDEHDAVDGPARVIRIYLSVFDVHLNRCPCDATVLDTRHQPGRHLDVRNPDSAQENEWLLTSLRRSVDGQRFGVRQIAGLVARRIVCGAASGDRLARGQRYGMIKFGSSTELIVPDDPALDVRVAIGDRVAGGRSLLAVVPPSPTAQTDG